MKIRLFAQLGEVISPEINLELPKQLTKTELLDKVAGQYPLQMTLIKNCNVAVNQTYIYDETVELTENDEIALIPPVSGG